MAHVPHVYLPAPWSPESLTLADRQRAHLAKVLRRAAGSEVSYTDGAGTLGTGLFDGSRILRGREQAVRRPKPTLCVAVAPPRSRERVRYLVEKVAELGVDELCWVNTRFAQGVPPGAEKANAWAVGALEQSRGAWLLEVRGPHDLDGLAGFVVVADHGGTGRVPAGHDHYTVLVGPEGGLHPDEMSGALRMGLSGRVLRTETAAVVAAARLLEGLGR